MCQIGCAYDEVKFSDPETVEEMREVLLLLLLSVSISGQTVERD